MLNNFMGDGSRGVTYRAYKIDGAGRIYGVEVLAARNDADALTLAEALAEYFCIELWERERFISKFRQMEILL